MKAYKLCIIIIMLIEPGTVHDSLFKTAQV